MHIQMIGVVEQKSEDGRIFRFPYAIPIIIQQLKRTSHTFDVIDAHLHKKSQAEMLDFLRGCKAKVYGISAWSEGYLLTKRMAAVIREAHPDATIIVGGLLARSDDALFKYTEVDVAVTAADGQLVLPELLDALEEGRDFSNILGISRRGPDGQMMINPPRPLLSKDEYENYPRPDYEYFADQIMELVGNTSEGGYGRAGQEEEPVQHCFPLLVSRGCPFDCTFCGFMEGQSFTRRKIDQVFDEMEYLVQRFGVKGFMSQDTNTLFNDKDINEFCAEYEKRGCGFKFLGNYRPTFGNPESLRKLIAHGGVVAVFGWESGSQRILDIMRKRSKARDVMAHARMAAENGMVVYGNFLFGMPGENRTTVQDTCKFLLDLERVFHWQRKDFAERKVPYRASSGYNYSVLVAMPTSELYDIAVELDMIEDMDAYLSDLDPGSDNSEHRVKQHVRHHGSDINLSEFSSKMALHHYIRYAMAVVKLRAQFFDGLGSVRNLPRILHYTKKAAVKLASYYYTCAVDVIFQTESKDYRERKKELTERLVHPKKRKYRNAWRTDRMTAEAATEVMAAAAE